MLQRPPMWVVSFVLASVLGATSNAKAQVAFVRTIGATSSSSPGTSLSISVPAAGVAAGNRVIVMLALNPAPGSVSCNDSGGNQYEVDRNVSNGSGTTGVRTVILSAHVSAALTSDQAIVCTHPSVGARAMSANEFSGLLATSAVDRTKSATGNNSTPSSGATPKTKQDLELLMGAIGVEGPLSESFSPQSPFATVGRAGTNDTIAANNVTINPEYQIINVTGGYAASATLGASRRWAAAIVTYRAADTVVPTRLAVTAVNSGANPSAGVGFPVVVQSQDDAGAPRNVTVDTSVSLSLKTGTGSLGGTLIGMILAGTSQVTIAGVTYTKAEDGVVLTAARTSGDNLSSGDSAGFTVNPGIASALAFTTQPDSASAGTILPGPPSVAVKDSFGNTVTASTASIAIALGANPGGAVLSGTTVKNAVAGLTAFTDLVISRSGTGYTLAASSAGLAVAISNSFDITASAAGIIAGTVSRVSNGTVVAGALVEAIQGTAVVASATTNASGNYAISGLSNGTYAVRASATGFVPQILSNVGVAAGTTTTVNLSLNYGIAIQSPVAGATINDFSVLVTGLFDTSLAPEVGIQVNGYLALQDGNEFTALVPIESQTTSVTALLSDAAGNQLAGDAVPISPQLPSNVPRPVFRASPALALASQLVGFILDNRNPIALIELDANGDGEIDFTATTLEGFKVTFSESGLYFPTVRVTEVGGAVHNAIAVVQIFDATQLDTLLQSKWQSMKNFLRVGNVTEALNYITIRDRTGYQNMFNALTVPLTDIDQVLTNITWVRQQDKYVEYKMNRFEGGVRYSYLVIFTIDEDGVWRLKFF